MAGVPQHNPVLRDMRCGRPSRLQLTLGLVLLALAQTLAQQALAQGDSAGAARIAASPMPAPAGQAESLPALLARALPTEPQVRVARSLLEAVGERRIQARSRLGPSVGVSITRGQAAETEFNRPVDRRTERAEAQLRWNLYNLGNDAAEVQAVAIDELAAVEEVRRAQEEAAERIGNAYLELLRIESVLPYAAERLLAVQRLVLQVRLQNESGKLSDAEAQQAEASLLDAEIVFQELVSDQAGARRRLAVLTGAAAADEMRPVVPVALPPANPRESVADLMQPGGPGLVVAAQERARAARQRVRPLASLLAPRVDLEIRNQLSNRTSPQLTTEQQHSWLVTARWDFPVGGELQSRQAEAERRAEAAEAEAVRLASGVSAELAALGPRIAEIENTIARLDRQIEQYSVLVRAGELQFEAGRRTVAQLIQLRDSRFNTQQRRAEQASRLQSARLRQLVLGGSLLPSLGLSALVPLPPS